jgi:tetratricopeptide (TPR) repeat protein
MALAKSIQELRSDPEEQYRVLVRSLRRTSGFDIKFVQCTPAQATSLIARVKADLPQKSIGTLVLEQPINNLLELVAQRSDRYDLNILFIQGLEKSLEAYIKPGYGGDGDYYNLDTIPPLLAHLNMQRENFRDFFGNICFVFIIPRFALKYINRRAPDFFDWRSGVYILDSDEKNHLEGIQTLLDRAIEEAKDTCKNEGNDSTQCKVSLDIVEELKAEIADQRQNLQRNDLKQLWVAKNECRLYTQLILAARHFLDSRDYEAAIFSCTEAIQLIPNFHEAWYWRGITLLNVGRPEEAIYNYDRVLEVKPDHYKAWISRGIALSQLGRYEEAIASYNNALEFNSCDDVAWFNRGIALFKLGHYREATSSYDRALAINPNDDLARKNREIAFKNLHCQKNEVSFDG